MTEYFTPRSDIKMHQRLWLEINGKPTEGSVVMIDCREPQRHKITVRYIDIYKILQDITFVNSCTREDSWGYSGFFEVFKSADDWKNYKMQLIEKSMGE